MMQTAAMMDPRRCGGCTPTNSWRVTGNYCSGTASNLAMWSIVCFKKELVDAEAEAPVHWQVGRGVTLWC